MHNLPVRVYYEDTDAAGIVYYANYLCYAERGRTEMLRAAGFDHVGMFNEKGVAFAVASVEAQYKRPARLDDDLILKSKVLSVGGASMEMQQDLYRGDELLTAMKVTLVCIDRNFKAVRLPPEIRAIFKE